MYKYQNLLKIKRQKKRQKKLLIKNKKLFKNNFIFLKNILFLENKHFKRKFIKFKKKFLKKKNKMFINFHFNINISKKSKNTRMGKGKGKIKNIAFKIKKLNFFLFCDLPKYKIHKFYSLFFSKKKFII